MPPRFFKAIKEERTCSSPSDNCLTLATKPTSFLWSQPLPKQCLPPSSTLLPSSMPLLSSNASSKRKTIVFNLIDLCHNDPTLSLDLHIILEAIEMEKLLEDSLGCNNDATLNLNLHTIVTTSITAAIFHGILDVIRDSEKFFVPNFIRTCFAGQGIINYFKKFNAQIHSYRTGGRCPTYQPYPKWCPSSSGSSASPPRYHCLKCKKNRHFHWNCSDYFCQGCYSWGPGHTLPNCPTTKAAKVAKQEEWNRFHDLNNDWGKCEGAPWVPVDPRPKWTWTGVSVIPNEEWTKLQEVIDLTSPSSSWPSTPPPFPLSSLPSLVSEFGDSSSSSAPSLLLG